MSLGNIQSSLGSHKRKRHHRDNLKEDFHKVKQPTFDGETKSRQESKAWILGIRK